MIDSVSIVTSQSTSIRQGIDGIARNYNPGYDTGLQTLLLVMLLLVVFNFKHCRRLFSTLTDSLFVVRKQANVFEEHTANEARVMLLLVVQFCVYAGILTMLHFNQSYPISNTEILSTSFLTIGGVGVYYIFQLVAYRVVGYVFTDQTSSQQWTKGFSASQVLLGFALLPLAFVAFLYPTLSSAMIFIAAGLYVIFRIVFIYKGFRIFYNDFSSLLYFILYLCTLEIIPLIFVYKSVQSIFL